MQELIFLWIKELIIDRLVIIFIRLICHKVIKTFIPMRLTIFIKKTLLC